MYGEPLMQVTQEMIRKSDFGDGEGLIEKGSSGGESTYTALYDVVHNW